MDGSSLPKDGHSRLRLFLLTAALASAGAGCSPYIGTTAKSFLRQARTNPDPNIRYVAYAKLGSPGAYDDLADKDEAVQTLIAKLQDGKEPVAIRAVIVRSLGNLGDSRARAVVIRAANDPEPVIRVEGCRALGRLGRFEDATILARIMTVDTLEDCRIAAIEGLGSLRSQDPRIYQVLLDGMDHEDPAIRLECLNALRKVTGKDLGVDPAPWRRDLEPILHPPTQTAKNSSDRPRGKAARDATMK
jgi:HEAT repeat protein